MEGISDDEEIKAYGDGQGPARWLGNTNTLRDFGVVATDWWFTRP